MRGGFGLVRRIEASGVRRTVVVLSVAAMVVTGCAARAPEPADPERTPRGNPTSSASGSATPVGYPVRRGRLVRPTATDGGREATLHVGDLLELGGDWRVSATEVGRPSPTVLVPAERRGGRLIFQAVRVGKTAVVGPVEGPSDLCEDCSGLPAPEMVTVTVVASRTR